MLLCLACVTIVLLFFAVCVKNTVLCIKHFIVFKATRQTRITEIIFLSGKEDERMVTCMNLTLPMSKSPSMVKLRDFNVQSEVVISSGEGEIVRMVYWCLVISLILVYKY